MIKNQISEDETWRKPEEKMEIFKVKNWKPCCREWRKWSCSIKKNLKYCSKVLSTSSMYCPKTKSMSKTFQWKTFHWRYFIKRHFIKRHFIERHFIERHIIDRKLHRQEISQRGIFIVRTFLRALQIFYLKYYSCKCCKL